MSRQLRGIDLLSLKLVLAFHKASKGLVGLDDWQREAKAGRIRIEHLRKGKPNGG